MNSGVNDIIEPSFLFAYDSKHLNKYEPQIQELHALPSIKMNPNIKEKNATTVATIYGAHLTF